MREKQAEAERDEGGASDEHVLPAGGGRVAGQRGQADGAKEGREWGWGEAGFFARHGEVPADGRVGGILDEGGAGVRGGLAGPVLLDEGEREIVAGDPVGGVAREGGAPGFFGGGEIPAVVGGAAIDGRGCRSGGCRGGVGGVELLAGDEEREDDQRGERKQVAR